MQAARTVPQRSRIEATASRRATPSTRRVDPLAAEVVVALAVKLAAILILWLAFFRPGDAPVPSPTAQSVVEHIAAPTPPTEVPVADR